MKPTKHIIIVIFSVGGGVRLKPRSTRYYSMRRAELVDTISIVPSSDELYYMENIS